MKLRTVLMMVAVIVVTGAAWLWIMRAPPVVKPAAPVQITPARQSSESKEPVGGELTPPTAPSLETIDGLLSNEALNERDLLLGLTKIVLSPARKIEERSEALSHLLNLTDEDHETMLLTLAHDPSLQTSLGRRLFEDAFNRSLSWQVDLGLALLERKDMETLHVAVREHLLFLLGPDVAADSDLSTLKQTGIAAKKRWAEEAAR